jgi:hypothetical protein
MRFSLLRPTAIDGCQHGHWWKPCGLTAPHVCQYCAARFCPAHGTVFEDGQEVCARAICQAKFADVARFQVYRARARQRNAFGYCGVEGCLEKVMGQCSRCKANYCLGHVREVRESDLMREGRLNRWLAACDYCRQRKIWR